MTNVRTVLSIATLAGATLVISGCAAPGARHDGHHPTPTARSMSQATPGSPARGDHAAMAAPAHAEQMKAMHEMHAKMQAAKTPEERHALMAAHMTVMHKSMRMLGEMGGTGDAGKTGPMGGGAMMGKRADMHTRHIMMEQRMEMMQSMMQMMMDRMESMPAMK